MSSFDFERIPDVAQEAYESSLFGAMAEEIVSRGAKIERLNAALDRQFEIQRTIGRQAIADKQTIAEQEETLTTSHARITELEQNSTRDKMTGLLNQSVWHEIVREKVAPKETDLGIIFIDLNRFKAINDNISHLAGDSLIHQTAEVLKTNLRTDDKDSGQTHDYLAVHIGRTGGDEFAVLCDLSPRHDSDLKPEERLEIISTRLSEAFDELVASQPPEIKRLGFSVALGSSLLKPHMSAEDMLREADEAMRQMKQAQRAKFEASKPFVQRTAIKTANWILKRFGSLDDRV